MGGNQNSSSEYDSDIDSDIIADGGAACFYGDDELKAELEQLGFVESTNRKALKQADAAIAERRTLEEALANHTKRNNAAIEALA